GFVGRDGCGLMPIRGHSGVQGGAEMGAYTTALPGGAPIDDASVARFEELWGFPLPTSPGLTTTDMIDAAGEGALDVLFSAGGNFLEVLPEPQRVEAALERVPLRVHMDIVLSGQMLVDPADTVLVLPAKTRYEIAGGVTETSTERRVIFSPEIPGPRIAEARAEWEVFGELAARVRPDIGHLVRFPTTAAIRDEIARAVPAYDGIQGLGEKGDQFQYGGRHLCAGWEFPTESGRARFSVVRPVPPAPDGMFVVATRRGKQFNSMVHESKDALTGAGRDAVFMNVHDAADLGLEEGSTVLLKSDVGSMTARVLIAPVRSRSLQVHWPEGQVLISHSARSPEARMPDYNAYVEVVPLVGGSAP
ncbi:MAG TPA: molybdopterin dinucleotide binding domain-containing protein, partial [Actinomycetota bacterium]|nr:molybdopterin dinucleotide binding domain-containing protein [Actinomycetota bacterium]